MKLELKIVHNKHQGFCLEIWCEHILLKNAVGYPTKNSAGYAGIKLLKGLCQNTLDSLEPKYQTKTKPVDAVQWFNQESNPFPAYYKGTPIEPGDWIVDGVVVTNEEFQRDYEEVT